MKTLMESQEQRSRLMAQMIDHLHVDLDAAAREGRGTALRQAVRACQFCVNTDECQHWFEGGARGDAYKSFCPNAERFANMAHASEPDVV